MKPVFIEMDKEVIIEDILLDDDDFIRNKLLEYYKENEHIFIKYFSNKHNITDITFNSMNHKFITIFSLRHSPNNLEQIILGSPFSQMFNYIYIDTELENYL
jgi:hypothetical protein